MNLNMQHWVLVAAHDNKTTNYVLFEDFKQLGVSKETYVSLWAYSRVCLDGSEQLC